VDLRRRRGARGGGEVAARRGGGEVEGSGGAGGEEADRERCSRMGWGRRGAAGGEATGGGVGGEPLGVAAVGLGGDLGVGWMRMALWQHYIHRAWMVERYIRAAIGPAH
jgi:hypothetical protein